MMVGSVDGHALKSAKTKMLDDDMGAKNKMRGSLSVIPGQVIGGSYHKSKTKNLA